MRFHLFRRIKAGRDRVSLALIAVCFNCTNRSGSPVRLELAREPCTKWRKLSPPMGSNAQNRILTATYLDCDKVCEVESDP